MKIRINLLPYREARRRETRRQFWMVFGTVAGVGLVTVVLVHGVIASYITSQLARNEMITQRNVELDRKIDQINTLRENIEAVKAQQTIIEKLQSDRAVPIQILEEMVRLVPDGMYLKSLRQTNGDIVVSGVSQSSDLVSQFMLALRDSPYVGSPELGEIKATMVNSKRLQEFTLKFSSRATGAAPGAASAPVAASAASTALSASAPRTGAPAQAASVPSTASAGVAAVVAASAPASAAVAAASAAR